jgi:hypothetical protein
MKSAGSIDVEAGIVATGWIANMLEADNPAFDVDRFHAACRPGADVKAR